MTVLNPTPILERLGRRKAWGTSPVHHNTIFYSKLAELSLDTIEQFKGKRRRESMEKDSRGGGSSTFNSPRVEAVSPRTVGTQGERLLAKEGQGRKETPFPLNPGLNGGYSQL